MDDFSDFTYKINGCAMKLHNTLGNGFQEVIYQRCLSIELDRAGLNMFVKWNNNFCDGIYVGKRRADFIIEDDIIIEL